MILQKNYSNHVILMDEAYKCYLYLPISRVLFILFPLHVAQADTAAAITCRLACKVLLLSAGNLCQHV